MALDTSNLTELTMALCDIESVSGNEKELCDQVENLLAKASHLTLSRNGNALIARTNFGHAQRIIIAGHLDTVPVAGNLPSSLHHFEREQVIVGRGSVDMKAGVAVMLKLAVETKESLHDLTYVFYDNEEVASELNGLGRIAKSHPELLKGDFAVLCEPTSAMVEGGCNGTIRVEVSARGKKAHSARPWMGENAIHKTAEILNRLNAFETETVSVEGLEYRESLNAVLISGGIATNVIPDLSTVTVNYRFAPSRTEQEVVGFLESLFDGFEVVVTDLALGARPGLDRPAAKAFIAATGTTARPKYGWTDVARFSALGIPAVNYGPGDPSLAHADDENVPVGHLVDCFEGLRGWLAP